MSSSPFGSFDPGLLQQLQSMAQPDPYASSSRKFQNGDRVVISESSRYFGQGDTEGVPGVIMAYHSCNGIYAVEFANGYRDSYSPGELEPYNEKQSKQAAHVTLDSVILAKDKKEQIKAAISQEENNDIIFNEWGFGEVFEKGTAISLLFWGIPGTGKTLMAQAIADTLGKTLKVYGPAEIQSSEPGGSERTIKAIFADAKRNTDTVILFDECDSLLYDRNEIGPILAQQVNALLSEIETFSGIVIFTTNRMGKLDPALERRITAKVEFPFPDKAERKLIWERLLPKKAPLDKDVNTTKLAKYPLAGGNIKNAVLNAARNAAYSKAKKIKMSHFVEAIEKEAEALQAFVSEYEKQPHQQIMGVSREPGRIKVDLKRGASHGA